MIKPSFLLFFAELHTLHCLDFYIGYEQVTNFAHALSFPADWRKCVPYKRQARVGPDEDQVYGITRFRISQEKNAKKQQKVAASLKSSPKEMYTDRR
jgi:hypothetical protein